jgi:hypothetical protein
MEGSSELPPGDERSNKPHTQKQIVLRLMNATSRRSVIDILRTFFRTIAGAGKSAARTLFSLASLKIYANSVRALCIMAIVLVGMAVFFGPMRLPENSSGRLDAIELAVKRIETRLAAPGFSHTAPVNPTTLLVAVQFVTAAAERSTPFDTALAVGISMMGEHPKIGPLLDKLLVEAVTGVPSLEDLRREFQAKLAELESAGLFTDIGGNTGKSAFRLSRFLGWAEPEISAEQRASLQKLSADVANHNLAQAVQLVTKLDGRLRDGLESWREKAGRRVAVDAVLAELRRAAFIDLIDQAS